MEQDTCFWEWLDRGNHATSCGHAANSFTMAGAAECGCPTDECFFCGKPIEHEE